MQATAIIAASGIGKRMQLREGESKQLLEVGGFPVIYHTLKAFQMASSVKAIYIATRLENRSILEELAAASGFSKLKAIIEGGKERQDSVYNCIRAIEEEKRLTGASAEIILVHDGARPFIRSEEIDEIARLSMQYGACVPANRPKDTIKYVGENPEFFGETLDRSKLLQVQTPQGFQSNLLIQAHEQAELEGWYATDDAALVERFFPEQPVKIFETGYHNIKITTPEDIPVAEAIFSQISTRS
ncbi:2-C-methyl-D-erythritol 4-phosphate cytidylyltransferase [Pelodictyon phaeoclathratiforme]|jgi:2-C-methyl-D-erythritol 4-phosphate cytidylyltransferase|uniref:2-C-methyl-D-erythritol 4-phosphate cytidylyltransferase n=1 Tax=Pelodictyon phaeoclathratiforme (strain DSM 5477 / BU-1) TaxID=324925 RepID=ISPD_PELPB|nr:2-C-methyl-D-erythritol 4-phosphate cytidylyltransferase [Pelodictyon phaeoclathratiforme]B4SAG7.1 RecName: Full=2-C-methyl-D-erythritol 4-phosphate cytidylyltransferase; AltName: Full=4-diphosphocytidyl-2C-methyl-D-erythritol synthase; AltName: Full=MEP cytidylyltransferase; Short=MCT [Pelodictyon phaeoclathratiforme BU-1]ACF43853.1 2-C-methyl-D-erythritol 4-phosphate cytidylyltransferase [Pelodictyon phaeoclathratiforme BU-1]MBV5289838.1 2-C-methyl-D-erythritol 4-phosphate cytidylyltransfer